MTMSSHDQPALAPSGIKAQPKWAPGDALEPPEQALLDHALVGTRLDLAGDSPVDHEAMDKWGSALTVRAAVLRHLLVQSQWTIQPKGVRLRGARISGPLDLESATVRCPLLLEDCYLDSPDPVALDYATTALIVLSRCRVVGGLTADLLVVTKELDLSGSTFERVVWLLNADITGQLSCHGAQLTGVDGDGNALVADRIKVGGSMFLDQGFSATGAIRLLNADITGPLSCRSAKLTGTDDNGNALFGDGMKVGGSVVLNKGFTAAGAVSISAARIGGSVSLSGAEFADPVALRAEGIHIAGQLYWAPRSPVRGLVDLERAEVHRLDDDWSLPDAHWSPAGLLRLAGFTYDGFGGQHQASWQQRLGWIRRSHATATATTPTTFPAQPYEQLARVYRQAGQESEARQVAIARRNDLRRYGSLTRPRWLGNWLLDKTIRHGYRPLRAVGLLLAVYLAVLLGFQCAQHHDSMIVPAKDTKAITPAPTALHCSPAYPCFYPAGYAVDVVVPIINLRQAENWRPNGQAPWGWALIIGGWIATGLGWAFTTLAVAGYTGLVRKD
jgi:hypothetical protein